MAARCLSGLQLALWSRSTLSGAPAARAAPLLPWIAAPVRQRDVPPRARVVSSAASQPYWDDDSKARVNVYSDYTIYKGKAAMTLKVIRPTWERVGSGLAISREGTVLLEFANALGPQKYDWEQKATFGLSAVECAMVLESTDARRECAFFHDPNKGSAAEGSVQKSLAIKPIQQGGGWFFTINVSQGGSKSYISCNVSDAELRLIKTVMQFLMPRLLGFDEHFAGAPAMAASEGGAAPLATEAAPF
ncbi:hypothetical protein ABPG77_011489 [Micractinium sp. CCAP 211/92]